MKKFILVYLLFLLFIPFTAGAYLDANLYYGLRNNNGVKELQEFLINKGFLTGISTTGNFLSLTLNAVKSYQKSAGINQTGYVGVVTRTAIKNERISDLKAQISLLQKQIQDLQSSEQQTADLPAVLSQKIKGCADNTAVNYNPSAQENDGSCVFSTATLEINKTYFIKTTGEDFTLQTFVYTIKPNPYYNKPYGHPKNLYYTIDRGNQVFLTEYFGKGCVENLSVSGCSDNSYQHYVEPNVVIPKNSILNIIDLPDKIGSGAFYFTSATLKGATTDKIITLPVTP